MDLEELWRIWGEIWRIFEIFGALSGIWMTFWAIFGDILGGIFEWIWGKIWGDFANF